MKIKGEIEGKIKGNKYENLSKKVLVFFMVLMLALLTACGKKEQNAGNQVENNNVTGGADNSGNNESTGTDDGTNSGEDENNIANGNDNNDPDADEGYKYYIGEKKSPLTFSTPSGVYSDEFELTIDSKDSDVEIYYTTDGSNPIDSETSALYDGSISIQDKRGSELIVSAVDPVLFASSYNSVNSQKDGFNCDISAPATENVGRCTTVRAVAKYSDGTYSYETSGVYFIGTMEEHINGLAESCEAAGTSLAVIELSVDYDSLFDSTTGIYVKGDKFNTALEKHLASGERLDGETARSLDANYKQKGRAWERFARITFFECDENGANEIFSQNCGIRIQGNYSRSDLQKSFRLYARDDYGDKKFRYEVFGEDYLNDNGEVMDSYKTLVLRAGGNCAFTAKFNDTYWQSLLEGSACDVKHSRPCVLYLNGEYWGLYVLEEDYTDNFFEDVHGVTKEDVVLYKGDAEALALGYKLDEGELPEGVTDESWYFNELFDFFNSHDNLSSDVDYEKFTKLVDPDSVIDYFAAECWINNKWDWPGKNWSMWKTTTDDGKGGYGDGRWRFVFYDVEFGGVSGSGDAYTNTIKEDNYKTYGLLDMSTGNPAVLCFAYMMTNDGARADFAKRLLGLSENEFEKENALAKLKEFEDIYGPLLDDFFERYPESGSKDNALYGGYASSQCIRDFLNSRENNISKMTDYLEENYGKKGR